MNPNLVRRFVAAIHYVVLPARAGPEDLGEHNCSPSTLWTPSPPSMPGLRPWTRGWGRNVVLRQKQRREAAAATSTARGFGLGVEYGMWYSYRNVAASAVPGLRALRVSSALRVRIAGGLGSSRRRFAAARWVGSVLFFFVFEFAVFVGVDDEGFVPLRPLGDARSIVFVDVAVNEVFGLVFVQQIYEAFKAPVR